MNKTSATYLPLKDHISDSKFKDKYPLLIVQKIVYSENFEDNIGDNIELYLKVRDRDDNT